MNEIAKLSMTAGQKAHEQLYGARLQIFGVEIPCAASELLRDFVLVEGGKSLQNMIERISFRADELEEAMASAQLAPKLPAKELFVALMSANGANFLPLKLGSGGLNASGLVYQFMAYDRDFSG